MDDNGEKKAGNVGAGRRGFLSLVGRVLAGGAIAVLAGWLISRGRPGSAGAAAGECVNRGACAGCGQVESCSLPQGELARRWQKESGK